MHSPFEGRLIRLRAREPEDEPLMHQWFNDPEVTRHLTMRYPLSHQAEREFINRVHEVNYRNVNLSIETLAEGRLIGGANLDAESPENRSATLGIAIGDKSFWDGGYGTDTMRTLCRFGFEMMNLHRIELHVYEGNARAKHVYDKIGFVEEGRLRQAHYSYGYYQDVIVMGLLEGELKME